MDHENTDLDSLARKELEREFQRVLEELDDLKYNKMVVSSIPLKRFRN